jgi:hypothetical protein
MRIKRSITASFALLWFFSAAQAQKAEVTIGLTEAFFGALIDSVFDNYDPPEFPIARKTSGPDKSLKNAGPNAALAFAPQTGHVTGKAPVCGESIKILREMGGVRTSVRIRDGKISLPIAFSGSYSPPFVGCVEFAGWADTTLDLEFDQNGQRLIGRAQVMSVNLNGSGGIGSTLIAKLIQSSLDKKLNPIEIIRLDKLSFGFPVQNAGNIRLKAIASRPELLTGLINLHIDYQFLKG